MTKKTTSYAGSQILLASENEFNSMGNFKSTETVGDARRLVETQYPPFAYLVD